MRLGRLRLAIALVALLGLGVATYLVVVHYAGLKVVCAAGGGGCEKVQSSAQSKLAGVPVAVLGLIGYVLILGTALVRREWARLSGAALALGGFGFSMYLTYEEAFSIKAYCQWCLGSAFLMTVLAVLTSARLLSEHDPHPLLAGDGDMTDDAAPEAPPAPAASGVPPS